MIDSEEDSRRCALRLGYLFIKFSESASRRGPMFCNTLSALRGDGIIFGFSAQHPDQRKRPALMARADLKIGSASCERWLSGQRPGSDPRSALA
jgi:hypothetical protein